ncbi:MAG: hypothetical protein CVV24_04810, partial [Ignavibacteriae bacterium HGW-Ignavibacteriae-3]
IFAQVASVTWPLTSTQNPNATIGSIQAFPETIGTGSGSYILSVYNPYVSNGQRLWTGNQGTGWIAGLPDYTRYIQFDASPTSGNNFTVQNISFNYSDNPLGTDFNIIKAEVWYSTDSWNNSNIQLTSVPLDYLNTSVQTFSKTLNVLVQNGQSFSIRIYPYTLNGGLAMTPSFATHKNVIIEGVTSPVVVNNGSICGMKFNDLNGNGSKDNGEQGLPGWAINLSMGAVQMTATTGSDGSYCFNNLSAGTYTLSETQQSGWQQTYPTNPGTHPVILAAGQNVMNVDFGNKQLLGSICGMKYNDLNGDGKKDNGELGLSGWTITLSSGVVSITATTGTDGTYCFNNLAAGTYTLTETPKTDWQQTTPASPGTHTITLTPGTNIIGIDFGNKEILNPNCTDFENSSLSGWQGNNTSVSIQQSGNNHFIQTTDQSGASSFFNSSKPLIGNWTNLFSNGCGSLCFDVNFLYGGNPYNGVNPPQTFVPYIVIQGSGFSAAFITNNPISVGDGWHSYCAPLSFLNSDGTLPSNSDGHWVMSVGTVNDWNTLLSNVTSVRLPVDPTSYQNEKFGFDNICLKNTGDCNPPLLLGSICGIKILDKNGDGVKDSNEDGIPNWTINLTDGTSTFSTTTDANGNYCFNDLPAGTYTVSEANRPNWRQIYPAQPGNYTISLTPGLEVNNINFSNVEDITVELGSICGIKFNDINGNGKQDSGELGLPNWTFQLTGASNQSVTTDFNGTFCFTNLIAGSYTIREVIQSGWKPTAPDTTGTLNVTLSSGQNLSEIYFGNKEILGSICGMKYNDLNGDGDWDIGEPGLPNWQITLSSFGHTSSGLSSGPTLDLIGTVTTDQNGNYCFSNLKQGSYLMGEVMQSGWSQTEPANGIYGITLTPGLKIEGHNFGNKIDVSVRLGSICGIKFNDKNGNGRQDDGELGIPDWQVQIGGPVDMTVVTDKEGKFCFDNLPPGEYKVGEVMRTGWRQTVPSTNFYVIQLASGQNLTNIIFGNKEDASVQLGSICGIKFNDKNGDGRQNDGELGIPNWTIYLEGPLNLTAVTDDNGNFCFYGLIPGKYKVREKNKTGWRQTKPSTITYTLEVGNGDNFRDIDFGNFEDPTVTLGSICGIKFNDLNGDGVKQDNEPTIPNWTIILSGTMNLTTRTDARGKFCFDNLRMGNYTIAEVNKNGWTQTAPSAGTYTIELTEDRNPDDLYFGNKEDITIRLGSICGIKFNDNNGNGVQDTGELGIPDWQINIGGPVDLSVKTDKEGKYCFDNLLPGTYIIKEELQTDWMQTFPASPGSYSVILTSGQNLKDYKFGNKYEPKVGCVNPPSGMVAWWSLDETSRSKWPDFAGYNNFGTLMNGPIPVAGKVLGALQFDGIDDYVEVADHSELNFGTGNFSFDAWIKTNASDGVRVILDKRTETSGLFTIYQGYSIFLNEGKLHLQIANGAFMNSYTNYPSPVLVADGNWHHIAITVSRTNTQGIIFYVDGAQIQFGNPTGYQGSLTNTSSLRIGSQTFAGSFSGIGKFKGILDEIELFNRVLTQAEIVSIFNAGSSGKCKPTSSVSSVWGHVFHDLNFDGVINGTESGISNWPVFLNGPTIATTYTDVDGNFGFGDLKPGSYTISVAVQTGWSHTKPIKGNYTFEIGPAQSIDGLNFGFGNDPCLSGIKTWQPLGLGVNNSVYALANDGTNLFAGGTFTNAGGIAVNHIAKWNGTTWSDIGGGVNGSVNAILVVGSDLYVGGSFTLAGNVSARNIAKWNGSSWSALGDGTNGNVLAFAMVGTDLYVGGLFTTAGGINAKNIAKWNGTNWSALGGGVIQNGSYGVLALASIGTDLYVGGGFWGTGGANGAYNIIKWNTANSIWSPMSTGLNDRVYSLAVMNGELYAGGGFGNSGGFNAVNHVAKWNGSNWSPLGNGTTGSVTGWNWSLAASGTDLFVGGQYATAGATSANNIAKWDGTDWYSLSSGVGGFYYATVFSLTIIGSDIYAGGAFTTAGNVSANYIAKYSCSSVTTSVYDDNSSNFIPQQFQLSQNYPNPFNPTTTIRYDIPKAGFVKISVYDILGREVRVLVNEEKNQGIYQVNFDAKYLASGIYFYTIRTKDFTQSKKMILMK